jgi:hypothetical protein
MERWQSCSPGLLCCGNAFERSCSSGSYEAFTTPLLWQQQRLTHLFIARVHVPNSHQVPQCAKVPLEHEKRE